MEIAKLYATVDADVDEAEKALQSYQRALVDSESAAIRLEKAQEKLNANTDPGKQRELANAVERAKLQFDQAAGKADRLGQEISQLNTAPAQMDKISASASKLNNVLGQIGLGVSFAGLVAGAAAAGGEMLKLGMQAENNAIAFTTMLGSTAAATKHLQELRQFAAATPFEFNDLTDASRKMMAFGFSAQDVIPMLTNIGDAVAGLGSGAQGIDAVTRALGQMQAKQKVQAGEMLQLTEAGIPAWEYLAAAMGKSTAEVMKLSEKGLIPADQAIQAILAGMEKDFGGLMAKQAKSAQGEVSNLADALDRLGAATGKVVLDNRGGFIPAISQSIDRQAAWTEALGAGQVSLGEYWGAMTQTNLGLLSNADAMALLEQRQAELNASFDNAITTTEMYNTVTAEAERETRRFGEAQGAIVQEAGESKEQLQANAEAVKGLNSLMGGAVGNELRSYGEKQTDLKTRAAELKAQIDELEAAQGRQYTTQQSNGLSANELALAQEKLAAAQAKLAEATDPLKQAQLAVEIEKLQGKIAGANVTVSGYIDNSQKIGELSAEYSEVNAALEENARAHEDAMKRVVFSILQQQAAADGFTTQEVAGLMLVAENWGLVDQATANATKAISESLAELSEDGNLEKFRDDANSTLGVLLGWPKEVKTTFTFQTVGQVPGAGEIGLPGGSEGTYNPTPTQEITPVSGAYAQGGSFVVPGSGTGDRPYAVNLTPGEGVSVTPVSAMPFQGGGSQIGTVNLYVSGAGDPARVADEVMDQLERRGLIASGRLR